MRNRIHGLNASKKEILSLGAQYFSPTVSSLSFGMFSDIGRKKLQYTTLPSFLITAMNSLPYGGKIFQYRLKK
jgi:hypothetical protein